jgi:hypothetical protein
MMMNIVGFWLCNWINYGLSFHGGGLAASILATAKGRLHANGPVVALSSGISTYF